MAILISGDDFSRIRLGLLLAAVMIASGVGIVFGSVRLLEAERKTHQEAVARRAEIQEKLSRVRAEELEIRQNTARFSVLLAGGIIGEERRLDWVEQIQRIKTARRLLDVQYEIAPQRPLDGTAAAGPGNGYAFLASTMRLRMQLLHEEDLLNFLSDLRSSASACIRTRHCKLERMPGDTGEPGVATPRLKAECSIDWITIRERKGA